jgi:hypothetical protein
MLCDFWLFAQFLAVRTRVDKRKYAEEMAETHLELADPKNPLHLYCLGHTLLVGSSLTFMIESVLSFLANLCVICTDIVSFKS